MVIRQAGETGQLYGSVSTRDIAETASTGGFSIERRQVRLDRAIKTIGLHEVKITLHPEVEVPITINVARSTDEAERQARGEDLTRPDARDRGRARGPGRVRGRNRGRSGRDAGDGADGRRLIGPSRALARPEVPLPDPARRTTAGARGPPKCVRRLLRRGQNSI